MSTILQGKQISKTFVQGGVRNQVLSNVDIEIFDGDFTVIMGASGAGKSTLLYALSGLDRISGGSVWYREKEISALSEKDLSKLRAREFGFVFQQIHLVSSLSLWENVAVAGYVGRKGSTGEIRDRTEQLLDRMGVKEAADRMPSQVSGGEAQRAAIARAMIGNPGILFADEPTGALNKANTTEVLQLLTELNRLGQSILMVTHDMRAAVRGSRLLYLEDGRVVDELTLDPYSESQEKEREDRVNTWLTGLHW